MRAPTGSAPAHLGTVQFQTAAWALTTLLPTMGKQPGIRRIREICAYDSQGLATDFARLFPQDIHKLFR